MKARMVSRGIALGLASFTALALCAKVAGQGYSVADLGTLGGSASQASGINKAGVIVGSSVTADGSSHAFLVSNGSIADLGIKSTLSVATAINESGQIAGYY